MAPLVALFDLDGTVMDSKAGILAGFRRALCAVGQRVDDSAISHWIGPPLELSLLELGVAPAEIPTAISAYRAYYSTAGLFEGAPFPGVTGALEALRAAGVVLGIATAKLTDFARSIVGHFGLGDYFVTVTGAGPNGLVDKSEIVGIALAELGWPDPARTVLVGDRRHDVAAARAHGIGAVGVVWGYGSKEELTTAGATRIVDSPSELTVALLAEVAAKAGATG